MQIYRAEQIASRGDSVYFVTHWPSAVRKFNKTTGLVTVVAGLGPRGFSGDGGPATEALLNEPHGVAVETSGNVFIADTTNGRIRKVAPDGTISTYAGTGVRVFGGDGGPATQASFSSPETLALDVAGNLYVVDEERVRRIAADGTVTTVAGNGTAGYSGDGGPASQAAFRFMSGIGVDVLGNLFIADTGNRRVRRVDTSGIVTTFAGTGVTGFSGDGGPATAANLSAIGALAVAPNGDLLIADNGNQRIRSVVDGVITTVAGTGAPGNTGDGGDALLAKVSLNSTPGGLALDGVGGYYVLVRDGGAVRHVNFSNVITRVAGMYTGLYEGDGSPATKVQINHPESVAIAPNGELYLADTYHGLIRKVDSQGVISTVAGNLDGTMGASGVPATEVELHNPTGLAFDQAGNLFFAENGMQVIRRVDTAGIITTVAGTSGAHGFSGDGGPATAAKLYEPHDVAVDSAGVLYIADTYNGRLRRVDTQGTITTVAGGGTEDEGVPGPEARLNLPYGVAVDRDGLPYVADTINVRRVNADGTVTRVAGAASSTGDSGDGGQARDARLRAPAGLAFDVSGNLYIADFLANRVRRVAPSGLISTVAGDGTAGFAGDGQGPEGSRLRWPMDVAAAPEGVFIADTENDRIRFVGRRLPGSSSLTRDPAELFGDRPSSGYTGDPVNTATGNFTTEVTDIAFSSAVAGMNWTRTYNSRDTREGPLGVGWSGRAFRSLSEGPDGVVTLIDGDGRVARFLPSPDGYSRPEDMRATLTKRPDGSFALHGFEGSVDEFSAGGRYAGSSWWDGQQVTPAYSGDLLTSLTSSTGYSLAIAYDGSNRVSSVTSAPDGRQVSYAYAASGGMASASVTDAGTIVYETDGDGLVTRITDADGKLVVANEYDAQGRVVRQENPGDYTVHFSYAGFGRTIVTDGRSLDGIAYGHDAAGHLTWVVDPLDSLFEKQYDPAGNLTHVVDRRGGTMSQTFDAHGNVLTRDTPEGVNESFAWDAQDRLVSVTDGEGKVTSYAYEGDERIPSSVTDTNGKVASYDVVDGLVRSLTDADGVTTAMSYDARRNLVSISDEDQNAWTIGYNAMGKPTSTTSPLGRTSSRAYDLAGRVLSFTDQASATSSQTWTAAGRLASCTDAESNLTAFAYDSAGRLSLVTDAGGQETAYGYDAAGNLIEVVKPGGARWAATYDALDRRTSTTDPTGVTTTFGYDENGLLATVTDEDEGVVTRSFDGRGRLVSVTDELDQTTAYTYDDADRLVSTTDPTSAVTAFAYDNVGRLLSRTDGRGGVWANTYTPAGRLASRGDGNGDAVVFAYDAVGRLETATDPEGGVARYGYNDDGEVVSEQSPEGLTTEFAYHLTGRIHTVETPTGGITTRTWTPRGQLATLALPATGVRQFFYDAMGRMERAVDAKGNDTLYDYDVRGNLVSRTDALLHEETFTYDLADRLLTRRDPLLRSTALTYDNLGRPASVADGSGRSTTFAYDAAGQIESRTFADGSEVSYAYDGAGRRLSMTDGSGTSTYSWDSTGNLVQYSARGKALSFGYDLAGSRTSLTYPDATVATYVYDRNRRLTGVTHSQAGSAAYTYDEDGRVLTEALPESVTRGYDYLGGRLVGYEETRSGTTKATSLSYDLADRIVGETVAGVATAYGYDAAGQLTSAARSGGTTTYSYDAVGNRTGKTAPGSSVAYSYDAANELTTATKTTGGLVPTTSVVNFAYDGAGRLSTATTNGVGRRFSYGPDGVLAATQVDTPLGPTVTTRTTDGDGNLLGIAVAGVTTAALTWDVSGPVSELVQAAGASGAAPVQVVHGVGLSMAHRLAHGETFSRDAHGSVLAAGSTADLARAPGYDEFGVPVPASTTGTFLDELLGTAGSLGQAKLGYRGELHVGGLVHLRAREYQPSVGRFTTVDPLDGRAGEVTAANPYPYAANDPLNQVDPLGLSPVSDRDLTMWGVGGLVGIGGWSTGTAGVSTVGTGVATGGATLGAGALGGAIGLGVVGGVGLWKADPLSLNDDFEDLGGSLFDLVDPEPKRDEIPLPVRGAPLDKTVSAFFDTNVLVYAFEGKSAQGLALLRSYHVLLTQNVLDEFFDVRSSDVVLRRAFLETLDYEIYYNPFAKDTKIYKEIERLALEHKHRETDAELVGYARVSGIALYTTDKRLYNFAKLTLQPDLRPTVYKVNWG